MVKRLVSAGVLLALTLGITGCAGRLDPRFLACIVSGGEPDACFEVLNPPDVPTDLRARALTHAQAIQLVWETADGADSYVVSRGDSPGGPYTELAELIDPFPFAFEDHTVERDRTYYYVVDAVNEVGRTRSAELAACWCLEAPPAPLNVRATSGPRGILVTWEEAPAAERYAVSRASAAGGPYALLDETSGLALDDQSVEPFRTYFYVVAAVNAVGSSLPSAEASGEWRPVVPAAPTGLRAASGERGIELDWNAVVGAESYVVARADAAGGPYAEIARRSFPSHTDDTVEIGRTYFYVVSAVNPAGTSAPSAEISARWEPTRPPAPTDVRAVSFGGGIRVTWTPAPIFVPRSIVARAPLAGGPYTTIASLLGPGAFEDTQVEQGVRYFYVVFTEDSAGVRSDPSAEVSAVWCGPICSFAARRPAPPDAGVPFAATFATTSGGPGALQLDGARLVGAGASASGTFELTVGNDDLRGTWRSATDFELDLTARTGTESGLLRATLDGGGAACFRVVNVYDGFPGLDPAVRGALTLLGADGDAAALLGSAVYTGRLAGDGSLDAAGTARIARAAGLPRVCARERVELRAELAALRSELAALGPALAGRDAKARLATVLAELDAALEPALWDDGVLRVEGGDALRRLAKAETVARTRNDALAGASEPQRRALIELGRILVEARYADAAVEGTATAKARARLDEAAAAAGTPRAIDEARRAWALLATP